MILAVVVRLQALAAGTIRRATGQDVHGLWFQQWQRVDRRLAEHLHAGSGPQPFTLSPLMGPPRPRQGTVAVEAGGEAWFRLTTLDDDLSARLEGEWLPRLPEEVTLGGLRWRVAAVTVEGREHPWAGKADAQQLAEERLLQRSPPAAWRIDLATPTAFHGAEGHIPFPLPNLLLGSWLRRWQAFGPVRLPQDLAERARTGVLVSAYTLQTVPLRDPQRVTIGCVGRVTLRAAGLKVGERAALDLLAAYAFWCGSGHRTTQGMGMTRAEPWAR